MDYKLELVLAAMKQKKTDNTSPIRVALLLGPGGLRGAYGAGMVTALVNQNFGAVFDLAVGVSTGAPIAGYYLTMKPDGGSHNNLRYSTVYSEEARSDGFYKQSRMRIDVPWLVDVFRGSTGKAIEWPQVEAHPTKLIIVATQWETGEPRYLEPKTETDLFNAITASISVPLLSSPVHYGGELLIDGAISDPLPVSWLMSLPANERPTHILVITNQWYEPPKPVSRRVESVITKTLGRARAPEHIRTKMIERHDLFYAAVKAAQVRTDVVVAVTHLPFQVSGTERDPNILKALTDRAYRDWTQFLLD